MITVAEALDHLLSLVATLPTEQVGLAEAAGRCMVAPAKALRDQPPFAASAMDGYAVRAEDACPGATLSVMGEAAAGHAFEGTIAPGQAARIFTGAPLPKGADRVVIQEDVTRKDDRITIGDRLENNPFVRPMGADFKSGQEVSAPRILRATDIALMAAMNIPEVTVTRKPQVALISTGDELVMPGDTPGPDQIIVSNTYGLKAMLDGIGANARILPIARDNHASLGACFDLAQGADLVVTIGGASVGDHDLVGDVAASLGMERSFYKVAMRPGKPLMAGRMNGAAMVGLPGNPVSAMVCGHVFLAPMIRAMLGLGKTLPPRHEARLAHDLDASGPREHYMRAEIKDGQITPEPRQDSALLSVLANANALMIRPAGDGPRRRGETMEYLPL